MRHGGCPGCWLLGEIPESRVPVLFSQMPGPVRHQPSAVRARVGGSYEPECVIQWRRSRNQPVPGNLFRPLCRGRPRYASARDAYGVATPVAGLRMDQLGKLFPGIGRKLRVGVVLHAHLGAALQRDIGKTASGLMARLAVSLCGGGRALTRINLWTLPPANLRELSR